MDPSEMLRSAPSVEDDLPPLEVGELETDTHMGRDERRERRRHMGRGDTALHVACSAGKVEVVKVLAGQRHIDIVVRCHCVIEDVFEFACNNASRHSLAARRNVRTFNRMGMVLRH